MDTSRIITVLITALVGAIVLAGFIPAINETQINSGEEVVLNNTMRTPELSYSLWDGSDIELKFVVSGSTGTYSVNGVEQTEILDSVSQRIAIASNYVCSRVGGSSAPATFNTQVLGWTAGYTISFTLAVVDGVCTFTQLNNDPVTVDLEWLVYADENGTMNIGTLSSPTTPFYTSLTDKLIILGNVYTTGDNDTFYSYYDGILTVNDEYADNSSVDISRTLADGYADIYETTVIVNVGDESFTPYFILAPKTVNGHESGGAMFSIMGLLPLIVGVGLLLFVVVEVIGKRY